MRRKREKRIIRSIAVTIVLLACVSVTVLAGNGNISFGGMNVTWSISSSNMNTTLTYTSVSDLDVIGRVYERKGSENPKTKMCAGTSSSSKRLSFNSCPDIGYGFVSNSGNSMTVYINGDGITTYSPQP